jgi:hypothetical protein
MEALEVRRVIILIIIEVALEGVVVVPIVVQL